MYYYTPSSLAKDERTVPYMNENWFDVSDCKITAVTCKMLVSHANIERLMC